MVAALNFEETPRAHAEQLQVMRTPSPPVIARILAIATYYVPDAEPQFADEEERRQLRDALNAAGDRFKLWGHEVMPLAMKELTRDPMGW